MSNFEDSLSLRYDKRKQREAAFDPNTEYMKTNKEFHETVLLIKNQMNNSDHPLRRIIDCFKEAF